MMPLNSNNLQNVEIAEQPSKTFRISGDKIVGTIDNLEALKQSISMMLTTERYDNLIYSWDYGIETKDLFGQDIEYVFAELKRRIEECLLQDDRILLVDTFSFSKSGGTVSVQFTVHSSIGDVESEVTVNV